MTEDMRTALDERQQLIEQRAVQLARTALTNNDAWTRHLGPPPTDPHWRRTWLRDLAIVAAYRERHSITSDTPIDPRAVNTGHPDALLAHATVRRAQGLARLNPPDNHPLPPRPSQARELRGPSM